MRAPPVTRRLTGAGDEAGAILVLALVFMIVIALVLLAVVNLSGDDLTNTSNLVGQQSIEYRSSGAMQVAIQTVRYTDTSFNNSSCFSSNTGVQIGPNSPPVYVSCESVTPPPSSSATREITLYACGTGSCSANNYTITATVDFIDGPTCSTGSIGACGTTVSIKSWLVHGANS